MQSNRAQSLRWISFSVALLALSSSGCSAGDAASDAEHAARRSQQLLSPLEQVNFWRQPAILDATTRVLGSLSGTALDSQNSLSSGLLAEPLLLDELSSLANAPLMSAQGQSVLSAISVQAPELVDYLARCAIEEGAEMRVWPPYSAYSAPGRLGLARAWPTRSLTTKEKRWVTACLMAHTNNLAVVDIGVSGANPYLSAPDAPVDSEPRRVEEAAFFGNLFDRTPQEPYLFACSGVGAQSRCGDSGISQDLERRICGHSAVCGFQYLGPCNDLAAAGPGSDVCTIDMPYDSCATPFAGPFSEVVTVYLKTDADLLQQHPSCGQLAPSCGHDTCTIGGPLLPACSGKVCSGPRADPYCCSRAWDSSCVAAARRGRACQ